MARSPFRPILRRIGLILALPVLTSAAWLMAAGPTLACSCAMPGSINEFATADNAIFAGTAGPKDARGVPVRVTTWFHGEGSAPIVYLAAQSFGDGASCGASVPPAGSSWIWVVYLPEEGGDPATGLCSPHAELGTPEGNAMVAEATTVFGGVAPPGATDPPPETMPTAPFPADMGPAILAVTIGLGIALFAGVVLLARWRPRSV